MGGSAPDRGRARSKSILSVRARQELEASSSKPSAALNRTTGTISRTTESVPRTPASLNRTSGSRPTRPGVPATTPSAAPFRRASTERGDGCWNDDAEQDGERRESRGKSRERFINTAGKTQVQQFFTFLTKICTNICSFKKNLCKCKSKGMSEK